MSRRFATAAAGALLATVGPVVVAPSAASAAASCYGGAKSWSSQDFQEPVGRWTTTGRCSDINVKTEWEGVEACVVFVEHTQRCNRWTYTPPGRWTVVASDVRDGTRFQLRVRYLEHPERTGLVAF